MGRNLNKTAVEAGARRLCWASCAELWARKSRVSACSPPLCGRSAGPSGRVQGGDRHSPVGKDSRPPAARLRASARSAANRLCNRRSTRIPRSHCLPTYEYFAARESAPFEDRTPEKATRYSRTQGATGKRLEINESCYRCYWSCLAQHSSY